MMRAQNMTIKQWTDALSSSSPTPGGGGVGALLGSLAACLASMVACLTINKEKYKDFSTDCAIIISSTEDLKNQILLLIDEDATAFQNLMQAYKAGANDEDYIKAAMPSFYTVHALVPVLDILETLRLKGNKDLISDVGAGASCVKASLEICRLNIMINLKYVKNPDSGVAFHSVLNDVIPHAVKKAEIIYTHVLDSLN
ncbi:MAG: hypothetical protein EOM59_03905 [Clostridia bacterium]|nr:hypothetical protein [Clostridia bacterium]